MRKLNHKYKILLVDDRQENLLALESILENEDYEFVRATSGREALSLLLHDVDYHLIILDVLMPVMNGFETAAFIYDREKLQNIPIIFLTALDIEGNIYKGYLAGAIDYISKPIIPDLLRVKVKAFVELSEKNRELLRQENKLRRANKKLESEIAERKLSEQKIQALNIDLEQRLEQVQSLDFFNHSVSHDLMGPLNNISALTGLLQHMQDKIDPEVMELINHINKSADGMAKLIKGLLTFSRQLQTDMTRSYCSMHTLVHEVVGDISITMPVDRTSIIIQDLPDELCDAVMLRQVWTNLISNAIKYSQKKDNPHIEIGAHRDNGITIYFVKDNGAGFDMKSYNKLFGVFSRLHTTQDFQGTGIGLAVVKRIIERHGGKVWADSVPDIGSNFYFTLRDPEDVSTVRQLQHVSTATVL